MSEITKFLVFSGFGFVLATIVLRWWRRRNLLIKYSKPPYLSDLPDFPDLDAKEHYCMNEGKIIEGWLHECPHCAIKIEEK